jgi:hypothetical protein
MSHQMMKVLSELLKVSRSILRRRWVRVVLAVVAALLALGALCARLVAAGDTEAGRDMLQVISTLVLVATLVAVIFYTIKTADLANATRDLARSGAEQLTALQQQVYEEHRPLLVPSNPAPEFQPGHPNWLLWQAQEQALGLTNVGTGPALNIASVLYGCESYLIGDNPGTQTRDTGSQDTHWTCWFGKPLSPGEAKSATYPLGASIFCEDHKRMGAYSFNALESQRCKNLCSIEVQCIAHVSLQPTPMCLDASTPASLTTFRTRKAGGSSSSSRASPKISTT